jgi:uncharacterized protein (DUF924 family)
MSPPERAERLLEAWFGTDLESPEAVAARSSVWFQSDDAFDTRLREEFGDLPDQALRGELASWRSEPGSALALVIALDQLPRNALRRGHSGAA